MNGSPAKSISSYDQQNYKRGDVSCIACSRRNVDCLRPLKGKARSCKSCRQFKKRCEYPPGDLPGSEMSSSASPNSTRRAARRRDEPDREPTMKNGSRDNDTSLSTTSQPPEYSHISPSRPHPHSEPQLTLQNLLGRTKASLKSLQEQYEDTNSSWQTVLPTLRAGYYTLQNFMGTVTSNFHELEGLLAEAGLEPGNIEALRGEFVELHARLKAVNALRRDHDDIIKEWQHLEALGCHESLDGGVLQHLAL